MAGCLAYPQDVVRALLRYTDWWQPGTSSVIQVGAARRHSARSDGIPVGLLGTLDERSELRRRMQELREAERRVLFLWYVQQLDAATIARELQISRRQCFRRRAAAIRKVVELGGSDKAA